MMDDKLNFSYLFGSNAPYIEELYEIFLDNPNAVDENWRQYFSDLVKQPGAALVDVAHGPIRESFANLAKQRALAPAGAVDESVLKKQIAVLRLVAAYRNAGVGAAQLDPLQRFEPQEIPELNPKTYGLSDSDMKTEFVFDDVQGKKLPLAEIIANLKKTYCEHVAVEYEYISDVQERQWVRRCFENSLSTPSYDAAQKRRILKDLVSAETLERYLHTKYVGQKRFGVEGGESAVAGLNFLIQQAAKDGVEEVLIGMAHRGRLNVLVNTLGKKPGDLFAEFEGRAPATLPSGDVKYHMGYSSDIATESGSIHVSLAYNPSHLEIVNPVVEGATRAKQQKYKGNGRAKVLPVLIHGDSAFIGLGVNQATFNLSKTRGYSTGGTVHIVINNQIGFTTSDLRDVRSATYCTDIAKMVSAPVIHVNGDDPERVCMAVQIALDYRKTFQKDIVIDVVCYRKWGHNEGDDPTLTQPYMYKKVSQHPGTRAKYAEQLAKEGVMSVVESDALIQAYRDALDKGEHAEKFTVDGVEREQTDWQQYQNQDWRTPVETGLPAEEIRQLAEKFTAVPEGFTLHPTSKRLIEARKAMAAGEQAIDWGMAETIAYANLVSKGRNVRISGEDSGRGTFSHRQAVLHDKNRDQWDRGIHIPLRANMGENAADFLVIDSILNEEAVMAYEYGYAGAAPESLTVWEAQFGDFANGAQVVIDQFLSSGETKWGRVNGLTTILPHGFDGQGPEHSSARPERWLQLCAEDNMQIIMPSEASQMFHLLQRQVLGSYRKPLVIFMSKRLLRFKDAMSPLSAFTEGTQFRPVIVDTVERADNASVKRVVLCAGQVYYDLAAGRAERGLENDVAIVRVEQLYPFPDAEIKAELAKYPNATEVVWAQEEPKNQGAFYQIRHFIEEVLAKGQTLSYAGRPAAASPAVGYASKHTAQLKQLVEDAFAF